MTDVAWPSEVKVSRLRWGYDHKPYFSQAVNLNRRTGGPLATGRIVVSITTAQLTRAGANLLAAYLAEIEGPQNSATLPLSTWGLDCFDGATVNTTTAEDIRAQADRIALEVPAGTRIDKGSLVRLTNGATQQFVRVAEDVRSYGGEAVAVVPRVRTLFAAGSSFHMGALNNLRFRLKDDMQAGVRFDHNSGGHVVELLEDIQS